MQRFVPIAGERAFSGRDGRDSLQESSLVPRRFVVPHRFKSSEYIFGKRTPLQEDFHLILSTFRDDFSDLFLYTRGAGRQI